MTQLHTTWGIDVPLATYKWGSVPLGAYGLGEWCSASNIRSMRVVSLSNIPWQGEGGVDIRPAFWLGCANRTLKRLALEYIVFCLKKYP